MQETAANLTVFFEDPFWVGLYERQGNGCYEVCKIVFGAEPNSSEVYEFILANWYGLRFSPVVRDEVEASKRLNPKRLQRTINRQMQTSGVGTKAQLALKLMQEQGKVEGKIRHRKQREQEQERQFMLRQAKHKAKHRGH